jgi:hypothetical protein
MTLVIPELDCLDLCAKSYLGQTYGEDGPHGCHLLITQIGPRKAYTFRGTQARELMDWLRDAGALPWTAIDIGRVHVDLYWALCRVAWRVAADFTPGDVVLGHSAGGAYAHLFAAMMCKIGKPPAQLTTFEPCCAGLDLGPIIGSIPGNDYCNGPDMVPALPGWLKISRPLVKLGDPGLRWDWVPYHVIDGDRGVRAALTAYAQADRTSVPAMGQP